MNETQQHDQQAQGASSGTPDQKAVAAADRLAALAMPAPVTKRLTWHGNGEQMDYDASAGTVDVREDDGTLLGTMFYLGYAQAQTDGEEPSSARPVTFCYNGGPGSSSVPINFGGVGPVRVVPNGTAHLGMHPGVEDNPHTLLRESDLVFLDALGTGWSRVAPGVDKKKVWGIDADANVFARAIVAWLDEHDRWDSPVYLFGESYGTVRNAVTMRVLAERGVALAGVTMLSALFDYVQSLPNSDLYYLGMLPTYAATAQWFGRAGEGKDVDAWFDEAMAFAEGDYAHALLKGDRLTHDEEVRVVARMAELCGLDPEFVAARHLRVELDDFRRELLRREGKVIGRLDTRFTTAAPTSLQRSTDAFAGDDPSDAAVESAVYAAFRTHVRHVLGYRGPGIYLLNNFGEVGGAWQWNHEQPFIGDWPMANVASDIAQTLRLNPGMRLAILGGRYDAATTWWNVEHDIAGLHLPAQLRGRIEFHRYGCGHMAYLDGPTLEAMSADMEAFYGQA